MKLHFKIMILVAIPLLIISMILSLLTQYHYNQSVDTIVALVEQADKENVRNLKELNHEQLQEIKDFLLKQKKIYLRSEVQTLFSQIEAFVKIRRPTLQAQGLSGIALDRKLQKDVAAMVEQARYGPTSKDYFWINDLQPVMVMHPYKPKLNGKDLSQVKDPKGKVLFLEFVRVCKVKGEGYVDYFWPKYGADKPQPKLSFVKIYRPWNWIIGTGVYVEQFVTSIAAAIEEQSVTTREIAENVSQASQGLTEVNQHVNQSAQFAGQITGKIQDVNRAANEISSTGMLLVEHAGELNELARQLQGIVEQFTV